MKKIGIVTFHRSHNCGSILQSYAMQEVLRKYGYDAEFLDFATDGQKNMYAVFSPLKFNSARHLLRSIYKNVRNTVTYTRASQNWISYDKYLAKNLNISRKPYSVNAELIENEMDYDKYLTGSDQVWNVTIDDYDKAYFLNFVHKHPKIAYAVSQGAKDIGRYADHPNEVADYIRDIDFVSSREENGQKWLKKLTGKSYPVVLDPTLLLERSDYESIEEPHGLSHAGGAGYIFVYAIPLTRDFMNLIRGYAKQKNLSVVLWHDDVWLRHAGWLKGIKSPKGKTPGKYLDLIKNANFVCTSSFHGVALSTIYRKDFVVLENDGMRAGDDDRMTGFLKRLKLSDRIVNEAAFDAKMNEAIDYTEFEVELKKNQKISHDFLDKALKD